MEEELREELRKVKTKIYKRHIQKAIDELDLIPKDSTGTTGYSAEEMQSMRDIFEILKVYMKQDIFTEKDLNDIESLCESAYAVHLKSKVFLGIVAVLMIVAIGLILTTIFCLF